MSKLKISRPTIYILLGAVVVAAWFLTSESEVARRGSPRKNPSASANNLPDGFTEADLESKFDPEAVAVRDVFRPVVERKRAGSELASAPNSVPSILTGGDPNWVYTGMAEVDGVPTGLLENKTTGEAEFVAPSQQWKDARVNAISPFSLVLVGTNGKTYTMSIGVESDNRPMMAQNGFSPMNPALRGSIGTGVEVTPERPNRRNSQGAAANSQNGNGTFEAQND